MLIFMRLLAFPQKYSHEEGEFPLTVQLLKRRCKGNPPLFFNLLQK